METLYTVLAIAACILLFSFAIFIHEFGHFLVARWRGLRVEAFSIGFGPVLWRKVFRGVEWRLSAIPFGGYVAIPDVDPEGTAKAQGTDSAPADKPVGKQATPVDSILVAVAGPMGNIVLAVVLAFVLAAIPGARFGELPTLIGEVPNEGPAHEAGMQAGDRVLSVGGVPVQADGVQGGPCGRRGDADADPEAGRGERRVLHSGLLHDQQRACGGLDAVAQSAQAASVGYDEHRARAQGPDDAEGVEGRRAGAGRPRDDRRRLRFLCVNLAILNLLPIPVLDGSIVMFSLFTLIFKRPPNEKFVGILTQVFMYLLIAAMLFLVYRDTLRSWRIHHATPATEESKSK